MSGRDNHALLYDALSAAVPLEIMQLRDASREQLAALAARLRWPDLKAKPGTPERRAEASRLDAEPGGGYALANADAMLYGGQGAARAFANYAKALAILAHRPGGVRFGSLTWCAAHPRERWPDGERICPACLREEIAAREAGHVGR